jgi:AcrR family transcriptional regulator
VSAPADHRRATAERNAAAILDAAERLLGGGGALSMVAIAGEAGVSRPTLYAHYPTLAEVVEAAVHRSVAATTAAFRAARPEDGPPAEALLRLVRASWQQLASVQALARGAAAYVAPGAVHRTHEPMFAPLQALIARGRAERAFRDDVPADWLVTLYLSLVHGADEHARTHGVPRDDALALLERTIVDVFAARS